MGRCSVISCRNSNSKTRTTDKTVKYHPFPKSEEVRLKWIEALQISCACPLVADSSTVCSEHFLPCDFQRDLKAELLKLAPKKILKPDAIPSVNLRGLSNVELLNKRPNHSLRENKENIQKNDYHPPDGFIISYQGVPRLLITSSKIQNTFIGSTLNQSRIIPLEQLKINESCTDSSKLNSSGQELSNSFITDKNVFKLDELCRLCGSYSNRMTPIFGNSLRNYQKIIEKSFPDIKISVDDTLPLQICFKCDSILVSWSQFHRTCSIVNRRFQSILKKLVSESKIFDDSIAEKIAKEERDSSIMSFIDDKMELYDIVEIDNEEENDIDLDTPEIEIVEVAPEEPVELWSCDPEVESIEHEETTDETELLEIKQEFVINQMEEKYDPSNNVNIILNDRPVKSIEVQSEVVTDFLQNDLDNFQMQASQSNPKAIRRRRLRDNLTMKRMCHMCGKIFKYPESLRRHLKTVHSDEKPFQCQICSANFNRNHNLTIHIKVVHQRQRLYAKKHIPRLCDYCGKVLISARSLEEHISSIHTKNALYECEKCHSTFYRKLSYDRHRTAEECFKKPPRKCSAPKDEEVFFRYCEYCGLEFKKEHFYLKHVSKHMSTFTCSVCNLKFDNAVVLKSHTETIHPEITPFECNVCGRKFKNKSLLSCHMVIHNGEKRYECEVCNLKFLKKKYLTAHVLTHTNEKPFECTICHKGFKQSGDMRKHKAIHIRNQLSPFRSV